MADGIFTPAVSVTSAVGGIAVTKPAVTKDIIPISIVRLYCIWCHLRILKDRRRSLWLCF